MRNNKGFTLVELLATIAILGIMSGIAVMSVSKILNNAKNSYYDSLRNTIISAAKSYYGDHRTLLPTAEGQTRKVTVETLVNNKYLTKVVDYSKIQCDYTNTFVSVTRKSVDKYTYTVTLKCPSLSD